ncbi:unnamed protein product [Spirodela intermedia]|uniref:Pectate lyase n=1 Tax=Spirodela intermedia TaxID=51605 RepID=A0A7I8IAT7_SPIIN|nr:unnamed protein product [Spirodela intermedia]CAA6654867.1 unnamed protein product [Spirodela intermedia]
MAPYAQVDESLRALAGKAEGFGRRAVGGLYGPVYHVTTLADDGVGSLREGCSRPDPVWIVFDVSGTLHLSSPLRVSSHKTIDGRGQRVKITGNGLQLSKCENVIVCNLEFEGGRGRDVDAVKIKPGSRHIWIDRCSLRDYDDGLIDITRESTDITISRCRFSMHNKVILIGADSKNIEDRCIKVTIHHCFFDGTRQRHPEYDSGRSICTTITRGTGVVWTLCEFGILSQCNIYEAGEKKVVVKYVTEKPGLLPGGSAGCVFCATEFYPEWSMEPASEELMKALEAYTGWQAIPMPEETT